MKKLMIALAAVAMAAGVQAANVTWGFGGKMWLSTDGETSTLSKVSPSTAAFSSYKLALALIDDSSYDIADITSANIIDTIGFGYNTSSSKWNPATKATALTSEMSGKYFAILVDTGSGYDSLYAVNTTSGAVGAAQALTYAITDDNISGKTALTIYGMGAAATQGAIVAAVPEPTSGLLLLLGIGAMALRRRRA